RTSYRVGRVETTGQFRGHVRTTGKFQASPISWLPPIEGDHLPFARTPQHAQATQAVLEAAFAGVRADGPWHTGCTRRRAARGNGEARRESGPPGGRRWS